MSAPREETLTKALERASRALARIRGVADQGRLTSPDTLAYLRSVEERVVAGVADEATLVQMERLAELAEAEAS